MQAGIRLKNGNSYVVKDLKVIKILNLKTDFISEVTEFTSFFISPGSYIFIGTPTIAVQGDDILSVEFG